MALTRTEAFATERGGKTLDQDLIAIVEEAAARFEAETGMRVEAFSGVAARSGTTNHPNGRAIDVLIFDQNGKPIPNYQSADGWQAYSALALTARAVQQELFPGRTPDFLWGGGFGGRYGTDLMHFDMSGQVRGHGMGMVSWDKVDPNRVPAHVAKMGAGTIIYTPAPGQTVRVGGRNHEQIARIFGPPRDVGGPRLLPTMTGQMRSPGEGQQAGRSRGFSFAERFGDDESPAPRIETLTATRTDKMGAGVLTPGSVETAGARSVTTEPVPVDRRIMTPNELERVRADQRPGAMMHSPEARPSFRLPPPDLEMERDERGVFRAPPAGKGTPAVPLPRERPATPQQPAPVPRAAPRAAETETARFASDRAILARGRGEPQDVRALQTYLNQAINADLKVDGKFGPATQAAVMAFQAKAGLSVDGRVGPQTRPALIAATMGLPRPEPNPARNVTELSDRRPIVGVAPTFQRPGGDGAADAVAGNPRFDYSQITDRAILSVLADEARRATDRREAEIMSERQATAAAAGRSDGRVGRLSPEYAPTLVPGARTAPNVMPAGKAGGSQMVTEAELAASRAGRANPMAGPYELTRETKGTANDTKATSPAWVPGTPNFMPNWRGDRVGVPGDAARIELTPEDRAALAPVLEAMRGDRAPQMGARYAGLDTGRMTDAGLPGPKLSPDDPRSWVPAPAGRAPLTQEQVRQNSLLSEVVSPRLTVPPASGLPRAAMGPPTAIANERGRPVLQALSRVPGAVGAVARVADRMAERRDGERGRFPVQPMQADRFAPVATAARGGMSDVVSRPALYGTPGGGSQFPYATGRDAGGQQVTTYSAGGRDFGFYQQPTGAYAGADSREYGAPVAPYGGSGGGGGFLDALAAMFGGR